MITRTSFKTILITAPMLLGAWVQAQVGINTKHPQGVFHIDAQSNNNKTGAPSVVELRDDMVVSPDGNIGLGTKSTKARIDVQSKVIDGEYITGFVLQDGNEKATKVLISDAQGNATWKYPRLQGAVLGTFSTSGAVISLNDQLTGTYGGLPLVARPGNRCIKTTGEIRLAPGSWWVKVSLYFGVLANTAPNEQCWIRTILGDDLTAGNGSWVDQTSKDLIPTFELASGLVWKNMGGVVRGSFLLNNKGTQAKTYYLMVGGIDRYVPNTAPSVVYQTGMSASSENTLIAFRISDIN